MEKTPNAMRSQKGFIKTSIVFIIHGCISNKNRNTNCFDQNAFGLFIRMVEMQVLIIIIRFLTRNALLKVLLQEC